uniref:Uncharacterized protein n=1 Tax=Ciona savignyi TaxID=51511 RepID=H2Z9F7_CIOSA
MDRSPERIVVSVRKGWVKYFHRAKKFQKTRSERSRKRKWVNDPRIKVDVSMPSYPFQEPNYCVKLAIHHQVVAFYSDHVLHCNSASFCNELCDFVCGGQNNFNNCNSVGIGDRNGGSSNPFEEMENEEFVNIDVSHQ